MKRYPKLLTIAGINMREKKINQKPAYQRGPVWPRKQKQLLKDTIPRDPDNSSLDEVKEWTGFLSNMQFEKGVGG